MRKVFLAFYLLLVLHTGSFAQSQLAVSCSANAGVPPLVRSEGFTEKLGDLVLLCQGGQAGQQLTINLTLTLNTTVTSPVHGGASDAILLIDEPNSATYGIPSTTLQPGVNMFRGDASSTGNQITFSNVRITAPGSNGTRVLRFTNIRANSSALGLSGTGIPTQVTTAVSVIPQVLNISYPNQTIAYSPSGVMSRLRTPDGGAFTPIVLNPSQGLNTTLLDGSGIGVKPQYVIEFSEGFPAAFQARSLAGPGESAAQNVPGQFYYSETGFYDPQLTAANEWNKTGLATNGTRLMARFSGVPAGASLYVSTTPWPMPTTGSNANTNFGLDAANLVSTDANGVGTYAPVNATIFTQVEGRTVGLVPLPVSNGTAAAVWEITKENAFISDIRNFAVFLAYRPGAVAAPTQSNVETLLAPLAAPGVTAIPRFSPAQGHSLIATAATPFALPNLVPVVAPNPITGKMGTKIPITLTVRNQGVGPALLPFGTSMNVYGNGTYAGGVEYGACTGSNVIAAGATSSPCALSILPLDPGTYSLRVETDQQNSILESDEADNVREVPITVSSCNWKLISPFVFLPSAAGTKIVRTDSEPGCMEDVSDNPRPLVIPGNFLSLRTKPGGTEFTYIANHSDTQQWGTIIAGQEIRIVQAKAGCTYSVSPQTVSVSAAGGTQRVQVTTSSGCVWGPEKTDSWLDLTATSQTAVSSYQSGAGQIQITVPPSTGAHERRTSTITVVDQTITVVQEAASGRPPEFADLSPFSGNANSQVFSVSFRDEDGYRDIASQKLLINTTPDVSGACYVDFEPTTASLRLMNDAGTAWLGPVHPGESQTLSNSQCDLKAQESSWSWSEADRSVRVNMSLAFHASFSGRKAIFLAAADYSGWVTEFTAYGNWFPNTPDGTLVDRYRLFNPFSRSHLHTTDQNEYNVLATWGFTQEGPRSRIFNAPVSVNGTAAVPLYRIYNMPGKRHFWTTDRNEYLTLLRFSWVYLGEGADGYVMPAPVPGTIPMYRLHYCCEHPEIHHWTEDANEYAVLATRGFEQEGIAAYVYPLSAVTASDTPDRKAYPAAAAAAEITSVMNAASRKASPVSPNQLVLLIGRNLPEAPEVLIGGKPARVVSASEERITILTPKDLANGEALAEVRVNGRTVCRRETRVAPMSPALFTKDEQFGVGQVVAVDAYGQPVDAAHPGSTFIVLLTGAGSDGIHAPIAAWIGGRPAEVFGVKQADTDGVLAVTLRVPSDVPAGEYVSVSLRVGEGLTQPGVSLAIQ